jgi:hypothetical protein
LKLERQMFQQWHRWREGQISRQDLKIVMQPIRQAIEATLERGEQCGICQEGENAMGLHRAYLSQNPDGGAALWTFLDHSDVEPTNNAAERALRPAVIHRKLSYGVQSQRGALC